MKKSFLILLFVASAATHLHAQSVDDLHNQAIAFMQHQQYTDAVKALDQALIQKPDDIGLLKDKAYALFLNRDYAHALETIKPVGEREDADEQTYQVEGMIYKSIADYKSAEKMYRDAMKKFPKSAVLLSEYGDLLYLSDNKKNAILAWESGIKTNSNYSGNYYYASKYYAETDDLLWSILYGEIFINLESLTPRTAEIKKTLFKDYQALFKNAESLYTDAVKGNEFEKAVAACITESLNNFLNEPTPESISAYRTRFLLNWFANYSKKYPYHLFDIQHQFLENGYFDAYNEWLFSTSSNVDKYNNWASLHDEEMKGFQQYQRNSLFKVPPENYYEH